MVTSMSRSAWICLADTLTSLSCVSRQKEVIGHHISFKSLRVPGDQKNILYVSPCQETKCNLK